MTREKGQSRREDAGYTLIEVILAVAIMGLTFVAILGGMGTSLISTRVHRSQASARAVLLSAVEKVKSPATDYDSSCPVNPLNYPTYLTAAQAATPLPSGWTSSTITLSSVQYWNGTAFTATCNDATSILRLQLITVLVTSPDGKATESVSLVKRG